MKKIKIIYMSGGADFTVSPLRALVNNNNGTFTFKQYLNNKFKFI